MSLVLFLARTLGITLPGFLGDVLVDLAKGIQWLVGQLHKSDLPGAQKLETAVALAREFADDYLDSIPAWKELDEDRRDRILSGLVELVLFFEHINEHPDDLNKTGPDSGDARRARRVVLQRFQDKHVIGYQQGEVVVSEPSDISGEAVVDDPEAPRLEPGEDDPAKWTGEPEAAPPTKPRSHHRGR
jgi:hypothetical protein